MFRVIFDQNRQRVPIRVWARKINEETERQLQRLASQPYVVDHICAMADAHVSSGIAVGSVFATERTVVPRALGGDLGCASLPCGPSQQFSGGTELGAGGAAVCRGCGGGDFTGSGLAPPGV